MAHIFVVNNDTLPIHIQRGFAGIVRSKSYGWYSQLADLMNLRKNDLVLFYCSYLDKDKLFWPANSAMGVRPGYWGVFRVISDPFEDVSDISGMGPFENQFVFGSENSEQFKELVRTKASQGLENVKPKVLPIRVLIEPVPELQYGIPIDDTTAYIDKTDEGMLWSLFFKKISKAGQARGITPLLPEEADKITRLLYRDNELINGAAVSRLELAVSGYPYRPRSFIRLNYPELLHVREAGKVCHEDVLVAWIMAHLDAGQPVLRDVCEPLSDLEFAGNHVQYGINGEAVDVLLLHRRQVSDRCSYRHRATVIEVKRDNITADTVSQVARYVKWIAQLTTFSNTAVVQPVIIGRDIGRNSFPAVAQEVRKLESQGIRTPWFIGYEATTRGITLRWLNEPFGMREQLRFSFDTTSHTIQ